MVPPKPPPSHLSTVNIDGLNVSNFSSLLGPGGVFFEDFYQVDKFDNVKLDPSGTSTASRYIRLKNCDNAVFNDLAWDGIEFVDFETSINVDASACATLGSPITITGSGQGYGSALESDPNGNINWNNSASFVCTWTGSGADSNWTTPGNWSGCTNGRGNYPDLMDSAIIPDAAHSTSGNQPVINTSVSLDFIDTSGYQAELTVGTGNTLHIKNANPIRASLSIQGDAPQCSTCRVRAQTGNITINNGNSLILKKGIRLEVNDNRYVYIGDGTTAGHFGTDTGGSLDVTEWPMVQTFNYYFRGIIVTGAVADHSSVSIDGLSVQGMGGYSAVYRAINFVNYYDLDKFDGFRAKNISFQASILGVNIELANCANAQVNDLTWDGIDFRSGFDDPTGKNISVTGCSSLGAGAILVTPLAGGTPANFGSGFANDPDGILDWAE